MNTAWDALNSTLPKRRIRGEEIPAASPIPWREQAKARVRQAAEAEPAPAEANPAIWRVLGFPIDMDAVLAFAIIVPMLFMVQLGMKGAAMVAALVPCYLLIRRRDALQVLWPRALIFAFPLFATLSVLWSQERVETLKGGLELFLTITAAVLIASSRNQQGVIRGLTAAFGLYVVVSLVFGGSVLVAGGAEGTAFSGLTGSKNLLADTAATGLLVTLAAGAMAIHRRNLLWMAIAAVLAPLQVYAVVAAHSAGALVSLAIAVAAFGGLVALVPAAKAVRAGLTGILAVVLVTVGVNYAAISQYLIETAARMFDKDPTLTGRTYIWYRAHELIEQHPFLGRGFQSFWVQGNLDAEGLWRYFGIKSRGGFTFHNTAIELLVSVGWVGLGIAVVIVAVAALALVRRFVLKPDLALVFWVSLLLYELSRTPVESIGILSLYYSTLLSYAALAAGFSPVRARVAGTQAQQTPAPLPANVVSVSARRAQAALPTRERLRIRGAGAGV
jgi:exopolysaccharide production protein ExoQ